MYKQKLSLFDLLAIFLTLIIAGFLLISLLTIIIGGFPYLDDAFFSKEARFSVWLSLYTSTISTFCCLLLALPIGYALARLKIPFKNILQLILELPLSLPYLVLGLCLLIVFSSTIGKDLRDLGFPVVFHRNGIILAQMMVNLPFAIRLIRTEIGKFDPRLEFVAGMLGASRWTRFCTIILPQCRISLVMAAILIWSRALGEFGATLMLVGVTRMKTETLPGSIYLNISTGDNNMAMASAIIILMLSVIALVISSFFVKSFQQKGREISL